MSGTSIINLEGGAAAEQNSSNQNSKSSVASSGESSEVVQSTAQATGSSAAILAPSTNLQQVDAMSGSIILRNPFSASVVAEMREKQQAPMFKESSTASNLPHASSDLRAGGDPPEFSAILEAPFSQMSARALAKSIGDKIANFNQKAWIDEDITGASFLNIVSPSILADFLEHIILMTSVFARIRTENLLRQMIVADQTIGSDVRQTWTNVVETKMLNFSKVPATSSLSQQQSPTPLVLFQTPSNSAHPLPSLSEREPANAIPEFMSEIKGRASFSLDDSDLIRDDPNRQRAFTTMSPASSGAHQPSSFDGNINITVNQPSSDPPKFVILDHFDSADNFYQWLQKNRKENQLCLEVDRRPLTRLISQDCKEEVSRIIVESAQKDVDLFTKESPYPHKGWPSVTESLLLKVLFKMNGPRSASAAKDLLAGEEFFFNDATTSQDKFVGKLRKHCKKVSVKLQDFSQCSRHWPTHDNKLSHGMIIDAFASQFVSTDTTPGPDGKTQVPRCSNLKVICTKIRENKGRPLEELISLLIEHFERLDDSIKANKHGVAYPIVPWRLPSKKRNFNQIQGGGAAVAKHPKAQRPTNGPGGQGGAVRPATQYPRCNNCGSKGHACGERTCYLFGHPKGLGANGNWPEGTPSLRLDTEEWKSWKIIRHPVFYAYPENKGRARPDQA